MNLNSALEDLFSSEFMRWRYFEAFSTSFLLQAIISSVICTLYKTICYDFIWNPLLLIYYFADGFVRCSSSFSIILQLLCYVILSRIHIQSYSVSWWIPERRLNFLLEFIKVKKIINSFAMIFICTCLLRCYTFSIHPELSSLTVECADGKGTVCISHQALLIGFFGAAFGIRLSLKYYLYNYKSVQFPVTQPDFLVRLKSKLKTRTILEACNYFDISFGFLIFVFSSYLLLGGTISYWIGAFVGASISEESYSYVSILATIIDARFICTIIISLGLLAFNLHCFFLNFRDTVLKKIELPICAEESPIVGSATRIESNWTLNSGMVSSGELLQLLSFRHLRDLAKDETSWGAAYRSQIFAISQPGGHPRNWQRIVNPCLNLIRKFCERLKQCNKQDEKTDLAGSTVASSSHQEQIDINKNQLNQKFRFNLKEKITKMKKRIKQLPFVWYLLSDLPDARNRQIFAESQAVIWAIEGLANIVAKSYTDDQFGVVQKNISDILSTLVQTQLIVEKVGRVTNFRRSSQSTEKFPNDLQLRKSLRMSLKTSLYMITNSYGESIREVPLSEEVKAKLEAYLTFQEG